MNSLFGRQNYRVKTPFVVNFRGNDTLVKRGDHISFNNFAWYMGLVPSDVVGAFKDGWLVHERFQMPAGALGIAV